MSYAARAPRALPLDRLAIALGAALALAACSDPMALDDADYADAPSAAVLPSSVAFTDEFDAFDESVWQRDAWNLGRGPLKPSNVAVSNGLLQLYTDPADFSGAEVRTHALHGAGTFSARVRCASAAGTVCAFFMYELYSGDRADEIDIEILPDRNQIHFTTWVNGRRTKTAAHTLSDPASWHDLRIERTSDVIRFFVDGQLRQTFTGRKKLPQATMPLFLNSWWPTWIAPTLAAGVMEVAYVSVQ